MAEQGNQQDIVRPIDYGLPQVSATQALTPIDMNMPRLYGTRWILCFSLDSVANRLEVYNELKKSLARTIFEIPWTCGKVAPEKSSNLENSRIEVVDGEAGVRFKFNDLTVPPGQFPSYEELKAAHFPVSKLSTAQLSPLGIMPEGETPPVMAAQANFIKGGLLLTICAHHSVCDAFGLYTVLQTWARMGSYASKGYSLDEIDPVINDRGRLMTGISGATIDEFPEYTLAPAVVGTDVNSHQMAVTPSEMPEMTACIFYITASSLASLKTAAAAYSSNDALHALFWRHVTLARIAVRGQNPNAGNGVGVTALLHAANMRSKLSPPLPHDYTGNASIATITRHVSFVDMEASEGLVTAAAAIRSSVKNLSKPDRVALIIGLIASRPDPTDYKFAYNGFLGPDLSSTSWADLDVYEMEWGRLGKPEGFRVPGEGADGAMIVLPRVSGGGLEVVVALESRVMDVLVADKEFGKWTELWA